MDMKIMPAGDEALVVQFGDSIDEKINRQVHALAGWVELQRFRGVRELLPTYRSLLVFYDPRVILYDRLKKDLSRFSEEDSAAALAHTRTLLVPCCYEDPYGPDLLAMEPLTGLSRSEIVKIHSSVDYKIYMLGFLPGFVYLGGLDPRIAAPRLKTPRTKIPARSVGIGGSQTGVYPMDSPGGWRLIGSTPLEFYDPKREEPILCKAGEYIRFVPISVPEYNLIREETEKGVYEPTYMEAPQR
ncbi:MAG: 5-oxoprolinase subunit PxpB [Lachnospiraceae bacterium]|jgi:inhibitor of KinA|nr:5-oxoprolinase subunit PxpB [Lachnospiraceae bacterium]